MKRIGGDSIVPGLRNRGNIVELPSLRTPGPRPRPSTRNAAAGTVDYRLLAESIPHIVWAARSTGSSRYVNRLGREFFGLPSGSGSRVDLQPRIHPDDRERARSAWQQATRTGTAYELEKRLLAADGQYRWHTLRAVPLRDRAGTIVTWLGTLTDSEGHRAAERQGAEALSLLETLHATAAVGVGFVDRNFRYVRVNERLAQVNGLSIEDHTGRLVRDVIPTFWPRVESAYRSAAETGVPVLDLPISKGSVESPDGIRQFLMSYYPVHLETDIIGVGIIVVEVTDQKRSERANKDLTRAAAAAIAAASEIRDPYTAGHQRRVAAIARAVAENMGLDPIAIEGITLAASIHDIGKMAIPAEILSRPGRLSPIEYELVKGHSRAGHDIVAGIAFPWPVADMILQHHERLDGSGYPDGRRGDDILIGARIIAVADVVEAITSHRPYRPGRGIHLALRELSGGRGTLFDPTAVDACAQLHAQGLLPPAEPH